MAISRIGSLTEVNTSTDYSGSVTVPSDAELMIVGISGYCSADNGGMATGATIASAAMTKIAADNIGVWQGSLFYKVSPSTGSQTLAIDFLSISGGVKFVYGFYKGIDTTSTVRDSQGFQQTQTTDTSKTLTCSTGDMIVAWAFKYYSGDAQSCAWTNATEVAEYSTAYNGSMGSWAEASPTGDQTVSATWTWDTDGGICSVVLKPAAAAVTAPKLYRRMNTLLRLCWAGIGILGGYANVLRAHVCERFFKHQRIDSRRQGDLPYLVGFVCRHCAA